MRAFVYWNLHKDLFSVRAETTGRVVSHSDCLSVLDATLVVQQAGRARVLATGQKNVHAGVRGEVCLDKCSTRLSKGWERVTYNPLRGPTFVAMDGRPVHHAADVRMFIRNGRPVVLIRVLSLPVEGP